jgi:hypothetical protein
LFKMLLIFVKLCIIRLVFKKNAIFFTESCRKSPKIVIIEPLAKMTLISHLSSPNLFAFPRSGWQDLANFRTLGGFLTLCNEFQVCASFFQKNVLNLTKFGRPLGDIFPTKYQVTLPGFLIKFPPLMKVQEMREKMIRRRKLN